MEYTQENRYQFFVLRDFAGIGSAPRIVLGFLLCATIAYGELLKCTRVIDGDTIEVYYNGKTEKIRLIGVDTPETVHPNKPIEYFGKEDSNFTRELAQGKYVTLEFDQGFGQ